jgi:hypothetical protein
MSKSLAGFLSYSQVEANACYEQTEMILYGYFAHADRKETLFTHKK